MPEVSSGVDTGVLINRNFHKAPLISLKTSIRRRFSQLKRQVYFNVTASLVISLIISLLWSAIQPPDLSLVKYNYSQSWVPCWLGRPKLTISDVAASLGKEGIFHLDFILLDDYNGLDTEDFDIISFYWWKFPFTNIQWIFQRVRPCFSLRL